MNNMITMEHNPNSQSSKARLTTLNLNFKVIEAMGSKIIASRPPYLRTKVHENLLSGSKFIGGGQTDRWTGDFISLL
jgi:hypothetical protein